MTQRTSFDIDELNQHGLCAVCLFVFQFYKQPNKNIIGYLLVPCCLEKPQTSAGVKSTTVFELEKGFFLPVGCVHPPPPLKKVEESDPLSNGKHFYASW